MKTIITLTLAAVLTAGTFRAFAQSDDALTALMKRRALEEQQLGGPPAAADAQTPASTDATPTETPSATPQGPVELGPVEPSATSGGNTNGIRMNFNNAQLSSVLRYLSDAAGFIVQMDTQARGTVTIMGGNNAITKDQAVDLLNTVLNKNGLAAIRNGQILTIVDKNNRGNNYLVQTWDGNPASIPNSAEMVTKILPIRFVEARQLITDLSSFVSPTATVIANEAANSIVITDTQANIRHLTEIIKAIDSSAEGETVVKVFTLKFANPNDVATLLSGIFPSDSGSQNPVNFRGGGGRGGGGGGGPFGGGNPFAALLGGGNTPSSSQSRIKKQTQVIAVADTRTQSVVVTASKDLMEQIEGMIHELDIQSGKDQTVSTVRIVNADPFQVLQALQGTFPASNTRNGNTTSSSQTSPLVTRQNNNAAQQGNSSSTTTLRTSGGGGGTSRTIGN